MTEESDHDKMIRLEEKLLAAADALRLAEGNAHAIRAEVISLFALGLALYVAFHK